MSHTSRRRARIVDLIRASQRLSVSVLAEICMVSIATIRLDLDELEKAGLVVRMYGGAILNHTPHRATLVEQGSPLDAQASLRIGEAAARLVRSGDNIFICAGANACTLARICAGLGSIQVMTNGLDIASELAGAEQVTVLVTGGQFRKQSLSFLGAKAEASLSAYSFDKLFLAVDGFDMQLGLTSHGEQEAALTRAAIARARQVIVLASSSTIARIGLHWIGPVDKVHTLVTDSGIDQRTRAELAERGVAVLIARSD